MIGRCLDVVTRHLCRELALDSFPPSAASEAAGLREHRDCIVMPAGFALHALNGEPIPGTLLERGSGDRPDLPHGSLRCLGPEVLQASMEEWPEVVFLPCGDLSHFGHLLTEGAGWFWPFLAPDSEARRRTREGTPVLFAAPTANDDSIALAALLMRLPADRLRSTASLEAPIRCGRALVPVPSMINRRWIAPHHFDAVRGIVERRFGIEAETAACALSAARESSSMEKVYLSRTALPHGFRHILGEDLLEEALRERGWRIVHPEKLPVGDQLLVLARARVIAGEMGSAFHLLMYFGREFARKTIALLGVYAPARDPRAANFVAQFRQQPVDFTYLACLRFRPRGRGKEPKSPLEEPCDRAFLLPPRQVARQLDGIAARALVE